MKAVIWTKYGPPDVLQLQELEKPVPKPNEVLIKVHAATVTAGDCEARSLKFQLYLSLLMRMFVGLLKPQRVKVLGQELAGEIEAVGPDVTRFRVGDQVFATTGFGFGAYAEYKCLPEDPGMGVLARKPANMTYAEAACVPTGGLEALHFLRKGDIQPGQKVLINGAGGGIGTFGVQLAKHFGAQVTAVDSAEKLGMLRSLGADQVVDYRQEDFTKNGQFYDIIFDVIGACPLAGALRSLNQNGVLLVANPRLGPMMRAGWLARDTGKRVVFETTNQKTEDLLFLRELIEAGKLKSVIDRHYPLDATAEAHRYVETGRKQGHVVIDVA